jgi:hypothetical protein
MQSVVPVGVLIEVDERMLWYHYDLEHAYGGGYAGSYFRQFLEARSEQDLAPDDGAASACQTAFDQLQDFLVEKTGTPWPGVRRMPKAHASADAGRVRVWFSDDQGDEVIIDFGWIEILRVPRNAGSGSHPGA